jgi:hypothetical protein
LVVITSDGSEEDPICVVFGDNFTSVRPFPGDIETNIGFSVYIPALLFPEIHIKEVQRRCIAIHSHQTEGDKSFINYLNSLKLNLNPEDESLSKFFEATLLEPFSFLKNCGFDTNQILAAYINSICPPDSRDNAACLIKNLIRTNKDEKAKIVWM